MVILVVFCKFFKINVFFVFWGIGIVDFVGVYLFDIGEFGFVYFRIFIFVFVGL